MSNYIAHVAITILFFIVDVIELLKYITSNFALMIIVCFMQMITKFCEQRGRL